MSLHGRRSISRSPAPSNADEDGFDRAAYDRRRQQVRKAQRSHRERRANYVKALEQEVVNLRNQSSQNIVEYEKEVRMLQDIIVSAGLHLPARQARIINPSTSEVDASKPSSFTISKHPESGQGLHLNVPPSLVKDGHALSGDLSRKPPESQTTTAMRALSPASSSTSQLSPLRIPPSASQADGPCTLVEQHSPTSLDRIYGINFVLALEHRCMEHAELTRDELGTHNHMATHNLLAYAPSNVSGSTSWEVPGVSVEGLLEWGTALPADGVITPNQAWFRLKQHPYFPAMDESQLQQLQGLMASEVKCFGYGAVLDAHMCEFAIQTIMMPNNAA